MRAILALLLLILPGTASAITYTVEWTAPGDDGTVGTASQYQMRYATWAPADTTQAAIATWWNTASVVSGLPSPSLSGTTQSVAIPGMVNGQRYWFVLRTADEVPNWSLYSNIATHIITDNTPPAGVIQLWRQ